jgi:ABC-2 type transport system permease protein
VLLFVLIGAATLYAGDYRWETWRLITARNTRINLLLAKLAVVALLALSAMGFMLVAGVIENLIKAAVFERSLTFSLTGAMAGQFLGFAALSGLRILQFAMMGMLAAVVTRSLLAALFVPLVFGIAQFFTPQMLGPMGVLPDAWLSVLVNPGAATDAIQAAIAGGVRAAALTDGLLLKAWVSLALWTLVPLAGALAWLRRQDLSKE